VTYGKGDLLIRDDGANSDLGPFHYRVVELKRSQALQEHHILQAAFYNQIVGMLQGYVPSDFIVVLKDASTSVTYQGRETDLDSLRRSWKSLRDGHEIPETKRPPNTTASPWRIYGNQRVTAERDLVLLAGIQKRERDKLRKAGVQRIDRLWDLSVAEICAMIGDHYGPMAHGVAQAYKQGDPILKPGRRLEIPRARRQLYFDFETSDGVHPTEPPHTYLIGCYDAARTQFVKFLARGAEDEGRIFEEFIDFVGDSRDICLYHWTDFEIRQMGRAARRWPALGGSLERIIEHCVDLKEAIQSAVYLPVASFSIKAVAPALGFHWRQKDVGAYQSMACYWDYLENRDLFAIDRAILYNEDDCLAMWHVDRELDTKISASSASLQP
jgi:uncharacterized protein